MSNNENNTDSSYGPDEQEQVPDQEQIDDLHDRIDAVRDDGLAYREHVVDPLKSKLDEALDRLDDLEAENQEFRERIEQLDHQIENLIGVDDPERSSHEKRVRDVRAAMIRRAEARDSSRSDQIEGTIALYYKEIQNLLADHGHGKIHDTQVRRIMDDIENVDGFSFGQKQSDHGREVKALRLNLAELPAYAGTNNVVSASSGEGGETTAKHGDEHNHD
jgi:chromosome segregation ATPase